MPNLKAAIKADRQRKKREAQNIRMKRRYRNVVKEFNSLIEAGDVSTAQEKLSRVYKLLDKAAKKGIMSDNKASRKKSRLTKRLNIAAQDVEDTKETA